jgi:hypothetical protein
MTDEIEKTDSLEEPSVLDYVKSLFRLGDGERIQIPFNEEIAPAKNVEERRSFLVETPVLRPAKEVQQELSFVEAPSVEPEPVKPFPWRSLLAFGMAWMAQRAFEPPHTSTELGIAFYIGAFAALALAIRREEWKLPTFAPTYEQTDPLTYRGIPLLLSVVLGGWAFITFSGNLFTRSNITLWILAVFCLLWAFWLNQSSLRAAFRNSIRFLQREQWTVSISRWTLLLIAATMLVFFFRFHQTASVPPEPLYLFHAQYRP